jgi:hypothetical protein
MSRGTRLSRFPLALLVVAAIAVAGCSSGASPTDNRCDKWCGNGSATVTFGGATEKLSGGGCVDGGIAGIDARFGDWLGITGVSGYLMLVVYRPGPSTPTTAPTTLTSGFPNDSALAEPEVVGSVNGQPFILGADPVVSITPDDTGSFSGTDVNGLGLASGTFSCR